MSRTLKGLALLLCLGALAACQGGPATPAVMTPVAVTEVSSTPTLRQWLNRQEQVAGLSTEEVAEELSGRSRPEGGPELFEYALLNHYSGHYEGWIKARDAFRTLSGDESLSREQRQMTALLEAYNQQRINTQQRYRQLQDDNEDLQRQLAAAELREAELQRKIQALTELEAHISTRKDQ